MNQNKNITIILGIFNTRALLLLAACLSFLSCNQNQSHNNQQSSPKDKYFIVQRENPAAFVFDMTGKIHQLWTDKSAYKNKKNAGWHNAKMAIDGGLVAINKGREIFKLDKNNQRVWSHEGWYHHDLQILPSGKVLAINRKVDEVIVPQTEKQIVILNEFIAELSTEGKLIQEIDLFSYLADLIPAEVYERIINHPEKKPRPDSMRDVFHANSLDLYDPAKSTAENKLNCSAGSYLISMKNISLVAIIDTITKQVCWDSRGINLELQHDASFTKDNNILIFNNRNENDYSEILLINPQSKKIIRSLNGGENKFYTSSGGSAQLLADGSILVGVTEEGKILQFDQSDNLVLSRDNNLLSKETEKFFRIRKIN